MTKITFKINDERFNTLKEISLLENISTDEIISNIIDDYIRQYDLGNNENMKTSAITKLSEKSFSDWDNEVDEIYNSL